MSDATTAPPAGDANATASPVAAVTTPIAQAIQAAALSAQPQAQPAQPAAPPPAAAPQPSSNPAHVQMTSDQLKQRLDESRQAVLKDLGFASVAEGKKAMAAFAEWQKSQMTEQERIQKELADAKAAASRFESRSSLFEKMVEAEFNKLPEAARNAIDMQAQGNADERYRLIAFMQMAGVGIQQPAPAAPPAPVEPQVPKPANAGNVPPAPKGVPVRTKLDEYQELQKTRPMAASAFFAANRREIEAALAAGNT